MLGTLVLVSALIFESQNECGGLTLHSAGQDNESDLCSTGDVPTIFQGDEVSQQYFERRCEAQVVSLLGRPRRSLQWSRNGLTCGGYVYLVYLSLTLFMFMSCTLHATPSNRVFHDHQNSARSRGMLFNHFSGRPSPR